MSIKLLRNALYIKIVSTLKTHKFELAAVLFLVAISSWLRLWKIEGHMTFLGDEGRDALVLLNMFKDGKFTLLGPAASVGGFFLGPAYYYLVIPGFLFSGMSPVGMATEVAVLGALSVMILYWLVRGRLGTVPAFFASLTYAVSPTIVTFSRSSWNPNVMPFLSLCIFSSLLLAKEKNNKLFYYFTGALFGLAIQSHYLGLILFLPIFIISTVFSFPGIKKTIITYFLITVGFFTTFLPFLLFEIRHGFTNTTTIFTFITKPAGAVGIRNFQYDDNLLSAISRLFKETYSINKSDLSLFVGIIVLLLALISLVKLKSRKSKNLYFIIFTWVISGVIGIGFYNGELYNYYFAFLFPVPFLLSSLIVSIFSYSKTINTVIIVLLCILSIYLLPKNIIFQSPSNQLKTARSVANKVIELSNDKPYNFALMASGNTDYAYRFFLEAQKKKPSPIEEKITDQLIVICEEKDCRYNLSPLPQIISFGPRELDLEVDFIPGHIKIFRLVHP